MVSNILLRQPNDCMNPEQIARKYLDHARADIQCIVIIDAYSGEEEPIDYEFLDDIEDLAGVSETYKEDFRRSATSYSPLRRNIPPVLRDAVQVYIERLIEEGRLEEIQQEPIDRVCWLKEGF